MSASEFQKGEYIEILNLVANTECPNVPFVCVLLTSLFASGLMVVASDSMVYVAGTVTVLIREL